MDWKEIITALVTVVTALGGWEAVKYLINRKSNGRKARAEADSAENAVKTDNRKAKAEAKGADLDNFMKHVTFLQEQLQSKEERFAEQTDLVRKLQNEILELTRDKAKAELDAVKFHCEVRGCANRQPPNGY